MLSSRLLPFMPFKVLAMCQQAACLIYDLLCAVWQVLYQNTLSLKQSQKDSPFSINPSVWLQFLHNLSPLEGWAPSWAIIDVSLSLSLLMFFALIICNAIWCYAKRLANCSAISVMHLQSSDCCCLWLVPLATCHYCRQHTTYEMRQQAATATTIRREEKRTQHFGEKCNGYKLCELCVRLAHAFA